jgi:hypothetical protein
MDYEEKLQAVAWMLDEVSTTQETIRILREAFPENLEPAKDARELLNKLRAGVMHVQPETGPYFLPPAAWIDYELTIHDALMAIQEFHLARPEPSIGELQHYLDAECILRREAEARAEKAEIARDSWRRTAEKLEGEKQNAESEAKVLLEALKKIAESEYEGGAWCSEKARAALAAALEGTK